jgi:hypothetical protein
MAQPVGITSSLKSKLALCKTQPDSAPPCPNLKYAPGRCCSIKEKSSEPIEDTRLGTTRSDPNSSVGQICDQFRVMRGIDGGGKQAVVA